ncbi:MAG: RluA family pseudouridine synthase [Spirochaetaceae bacterium]|nr:RluA family pseudouridine synthase [Spirochaetaceae bacterium]
MKGYTILFENDDILVLDKAAGLAVQGGAGVGVSLDRLLEAARNPRPLLVHRLDRDTSGVMITAKSREAASRLAAAWKRRDAAGGVSKYYLAVCAGNPGAAGVIDTDLAVHGRTRNAETRWRRLSSHALVEYAPPGASAGAYAVLEIEPGTGRLHQIRRHLAGHGWPILGDGKYGDFALNKRLRQSRSLRNLLLHAARLVIGGGALGYPLDISAPLPPWFVPWVHPGEL